MQFNTELQETEQASNTKNKQKTLIKKIKNKKIKNKRRRKRHITKLKEQMLPSPLTFKIKNWTIHLYFLTPV